MKQMWVAAIIGMFIITVAGIAGAADMSQGMGQGMAMEGMGQAGHAMEGMGQAGHGMDMGGANQAMNMDMNEAGQAENTIHSSDVEGYHMTYQLFELKPTGQGNQPAHHLMVSIQDQNGTPVENAKVGYIVTGPDGKDQKLMCMGMGGGYGANLDLSASGDYVIKSKAVVGDKKMIDSFTYTVK